jgi:Tfp pilus assembly protein PilF
MRSVWLTLVLGAIATGSPDDVPSQLAAFDREITAGHYAEVEAPLEQFAAEHPTSASGWYQLGYVYFRTHKIWPSVKALSKSLSLDSRQSEAHKVLGLDFTILGRMDLATDELRRAAALNPTSAEIKYHLGRVYYETGDYSRAKSALEAAVQRDPANVKALHNLALTYEAVRENDRARECFRKAIALDQAFPKHSEWPYLNFGGFLNRREEFSQALSVLRDAQRINPQSDEVAFELAKAYRGVEQYEPALESLLKAVKLNPQNAQYHYVLSLTYRKLGKGEQALQSLAEFERLKKH